jgi:hypothetical protein
MLGLGRCDRFSKLRSRIIRKCFTSNPEDDITHRDDSISWRAFIDRSDSDLTRIGGHQLVAEHPTSQTGGSKIPIMMRVSRDDISFGKVRYGERPCILRDGYLSR